MSSLQKLFTGPANSVSCRSCGKGITLRWRHFLYLLIPTVLALVVMKLLELAPLAILLVGLVLVAIAAVIQLRFIPLSGDRW